MSSYFRKKKYCRFTTGELKEVDYKDPILVEYASESGRIIPARISGTATKYQRLVTQAIKRARYLALLPYCDKHKK